jgi:hypothetical protein
MPCSRYLPVPCSLLLLGLALTSDVLAQSKPEEIVYATNSAGNRIVRVNFDTLTTSEVNSASDAKRRKKLQGLAVRNDGGGVVNLIVADGDGNGGVVVFYGNVEGPGFLGNGQVITNQIPLPDGVSLDAAGNIYAVNSGPGNGSQKKRTVFRILRNGTGPGGYGDLEVIDDTVASSALQDTKFVRASTAGGLQAGDLLVLSASPARLFRYPNAATCAPVSACVASRVEFLGTSAFAGASPQGMAFAPDGNLLVATSSGDILRFTPTGARLGNFFAGLGNGPFKIAVGFQDKTNGAFVAQRNGTKVLSFNIAADGTGVLGPTVTRGLNAPVGVGLGTGNAAPTRAGSDVTVQLHTFTSTFDTITTSGLTDAACGEYADPRQGECTGESACGPAEHPGTCDAGFCRRELTVAELTGGRINLNVLIPDHVRAFGKGTPTGTPTFFLCETATTARFAGTINHIEEEGEWLKWPHSGPVGPGNGEPPCRDSDPGGEDRTQQVRAFWAPIPGTEPGITEGNRFIDISNGCTGSNRSTPPNYSLFLPAVRDTRTVPDIVGDKLDELLATIADFRSRGFITPNSSSGAGDPRITSSDCETNTGELENSMEVDVQAAKSNMGEDPGFANCQLRDFIKIVDTNPGNFHDTASGETRSTVGELKSRAISAIFFLCKLNAEGPGCVDELRP